MARFSMRTMLAPIDGNGQYRPTAVPRAVATLTARAGRLSCPVTPGKKKVHRGLPGNAARILRKKYSSSRYP